jgi:aspartate-semialdehyde dehydrogenase
MKGTLMSARIPVAVIGATGVVGQRFVRRLAHHPWFELRGLAASERSAGKRYRDACEWRLGGEPYAGAGDLVIAASDTDSIDEPIVFSALDSGPARELEPALAGAGAWVFSNASAFRMDSDVPLLVPEVNGEHLALVPAQRVRRGWTGAIVCNPNCTATVLVMALAPLQAAFGIEAVLMTSMQAASGAGYPGVPSLDILGNVIPFIAGEEEKVEAETRKILAAEIPVSALCNRVPVVDGHSEAVSLRLRGNPALDEVRAVLANWRPAIADFDLPSAPPSPLRLHEQANRPQPRLDLTEDWSARSGMTVHVGRVRACPVLGIKLNVLGHNTERGAAGGSVLNAELALASGALGEIENTVAGESARRR